jgi:hypothetical protein
MSHIYAVTKIPYKICSVARGRVHSPDAETRKTDPKNGGMHGDSMRRKKIAGGSKMMVNRKCLPVEDQL